MVFKKIVFLISCHHNIKTIKFSTIWLILRAVIYCEFNIKSLTLNMIDMLYRNQPIDWLYEIKQKGQDLTCYVMVPKAGVCVLFFNY